MIHKQKVLFIVPNLKNMFGGKGGTPGHPHVGIASLASYLEQEAPGMYEISIFDEGIERDNKKLIEQVKSFKPDVIGITTFSYCYVSVLDTVKRVSNVSRAPIILGGAHISAVRGEALKDSPHVAFGVKSEGEITLLELLGALRKKEKDFGNIKGLIWRKGRRIIENSDRELIEDVDKLPFPKYEHFDLSRYPCYESKALPILTSRGCPYGCNYCSVKLSMGRGFRARSAGNVLKEINYWYKKGFNSFDINDDCFTLDLNRAEKICDMIFKRKIKLKLQLYNGIRVDRVTPKLLRKLKKAGTTFIAYGCETGNQDTLDIIKKNIKLDQVVRAVNWTNKAGIKNAVNFIVGHEGETFERAMDSIKFANKLKSNFVNFYNLVPYPGTAVFEWAKLNANFLVPQDSFLKEISYRNNSPIFETKEFTKEQREFVMKKGFNLYEKKLLQFRFGSVIGTIGYFLTRLEMIHDLSLRIISSRKGWQLYSRLSNRDKE